MKCSKCGGNNEDGSLKCAYCDSNLLENDETKKSDDNNVNNQEDKRLDKCYKISRIILAIVTFIVFKIMFVNEDESWNEVAIVFSMIVFVFSFFSKKNSLKIMSKGNKLEGSKKFFYYFVDLPSIMFGIFIAIYIIVLIVFLIIIPSPNELSAALGQAVIGLFIVMLGTIWIILPYIQTLIVLVIRKFIKK